MLIENQLINIKWDKSNRNYYENLGYEFTKRGESFVVSPSNLPKSSNKKIKVICDCCLKEYEIIYIHPLPFDFYLPDNNCIIEFDGEQHFKEQHFFNNAKISYIQKHDKIKTEYCANHNIYLIRIPYTQINNIEKILDNEFIA